MAYDIVVGMFKRVKENIYKLYYNILIRYSIIC